MEKAGVRRMVLCSSSVTVGFGSKEEPGDEDTPLDPSAIYGTTGALRAYYDTTSVSSSLPVGTVSKWSLLIQTSFWGPGCQPTSGQSL